MKLSKILQKCQTNFLVENFFDFDVIDLSADSRVIKNNYIFAAILGAKDNGENYINQVIKNRKIAIIISKKSKIKIKNRNTVLIRTTKVRRLFSEIASITHQNFIEEKVAITGTNGKTSISDYTRQIWEKLNFTGRNRNLRNQACLITKFSSNLKMI